LHQGFRIGYGRHTPNRLKARLGITAGAGFCVYGGKMAEGYIGLDDGVRVFYKKAGDGERTLLILNGFFLFEDFRYLAVNRQVIAIDLRNRGQSEYVADFSKMKRGVQQDADDIELVRRHFDIDQIDLLAHSYAGIIPILYAVKYPSPVRRIVQIGSMQPDQSTQYPAHLTNSDSVFQEFFANIGELQKKRQSLAPEEFCAKFWTFLRPLYVFNPDDAEKLRHWYSCHLPTELNLMRYWMEVLMPSIQSLHFTAEELAGVKAPVLNVHGTKDRSAPYGGARDWARILPNARLLTLDNVAHVPWIEAPEKVLGPIQTFLDGTWPETAREVDAL
jgi:3-oxoadipate enol-lactonase